MTRRRSLLAALALLLCSAVEAGAVGTRSFLLDSEEDYDGGDLKGVAIDSTGKLRAGLNLGATAVSDATAVWSALPMPDGSVLLGTGNEGKLLRLTGAATKVVAETKALVITSLVQAWGGAVVMGTLPEGKVLKLDGDKVSELVKLKDTEHVWQVAFDSKANVLYAATGPEGKLYRITAGGQAQVYFDAEEQHLMSVVVAPDGTVYTGASDKAKLYKVTGPGRASVLYDFARTEVRALALGPKGELYAIANEIKGGTQAPPKSKGTRPAGPSETPKPTKGSGTLYRFAPDGTPEQLLDDDKEHYVSLTVGDDGQPYVGTGAEGKIYTIDQNHNSVLVADTDERQIGALSLTGKTRFVASSDPVVVHPVRGVGGTDAVWTSKVLDAGLRAQFGRLSWDAEGALDISTRTGNTAEPDDTWSDWSRDLTAPAVVGSPAGRYLQVRARWSRDPKAVLREVRIPFVTDNLRAVLTEVTAESPASQDDSSKLEESGGPISDKADTKVNLKWKLDNPDKDKMRYRVAYQLIGTNEWYDVLKPTELLTSENYTWDTADLPEGRYRIRVSASDELSNPPTRAKNHRLESGVVLVDNTPPAIVDLRATGRVLDGVVLDGVGPIQRIEVSVAGSEEWYPFYPKDGIFDEQREEFTADISGFAAGGALLVSVRAYDSANNFVVRHVSVK